MATLFVLSAAVQYNDPDPIPWMTLYGVAAVLSAAAPRVPAARTVMRMVALTALLWAVHIAPGAWGADWGEVFGATTMKTPAVEVARETLGLLIVAVWLAALSCLRLGARSTRRLRQAEEAGG